MTIVSAQITPADVERIERKLDAIIEHFHIGEEPRKSTRDIKAQAEADIIRLTSRRKRVKK